MPSVSPLQEADQEKHSDVTLSLAENKTICRIDTPPISLDRADRVTIPGVGEAIVYPVYWFLSKKPLGKEIIRRIAHELLVDPILQTSVISSADEPAIPAFSGFKTHWILEKQFLPGVTDNLGKTVESSIRLLFRGEDLPEIHVASGQVYWLPETNMPKTELLKTVEYVLCNPVVQRMRVFSTETAKTDDSRYNFPTVHIAPHSDPEIIPLDVSDENLIQLSKSRCLALTLDEMKVIQAYYKNRSTWPTDIELEVIAQTWSEHCKHKIFAAKIDYTDLTHPDYPQHQVIDSLFKTYIAGSTIKLMEKRPDLLSVFVDNAGVIRWNDDWAVCFKVETHNSPSALEPYGGALTGIVGVNRDILGTGLGAKPLFNTDVFCFAHPEEPHAKRPTMLPPEAILEGVRKGVEDGGNKSGIPVVNGALFFDPRYRAKPLVFCGTGGLLPITVNGKPGYGKFTQPGDTIVMAGGRVGKDGIHGATFSSEALNEDSPVTAVQIGDPLTQKRMTDFLMTARDMGLLTGMTDNGAGGLSSSVGEMAQLTNGATIHLEKIPLKYPGLAPYEIVISESQERMTLSTHDYPALKALADRYEVEISAIGEFHAKGTFDIIRSGQILASLELDFLHDGLPQMQMKALWEKPKSKTMCAHPPQDPGNILLKLLADPNICSREALIRQYDHEVQGQSVIKPLMGQDQTAPCDAAVIQPILGEKQGLVVSNGLCPQFSDWDAFHMAQCAVDEAVRNAVAVGADPKSIVLLDNFCWPDPLPSLRNMDAEHKASQLVRACQGLYNISLAYEAPFVSGKDIMKNDFDDGELRLSIPPTVLISALGKMPDFEKAVSMEFKAPDDQIFLLGKTNVHMGGSHYYKRMGWYAPYCPQVNIPMARELYQVLYHCISEGWIRSCHDLSEGGLAIALAECVLGGRYGATISLEEIMHDSPELRWDEALFSESASRFVVSVPTQYVDKVKPAFKDLPLLHLGIVTEALTLTISLDGGKPLMQLENQVLRNAWRRAPAECYEGAIQP